MKLDLGSRPLKRILGEISNGKGPVLFCLAGIHGNEIAGIKALYKVFDILKESNIEVNGTIIGIAGNLKALSTGERFIDIDMNRQWERGNIQRILSYTNGEPKLKEEAEIREILELIYTYHGKDPNNFLFLDLHTTSAFGGVFAIINNIRRSLIYASSLNVPVLTGIHKVLRVTSISYLQEKGIPAVGFEAGQHNAPASVENIVAAIFLLLSGLGIVNRDQILQYQYYNYHLHQYGEGLPQIVEFIYRHQVNEGDEFRMRHGYENFQKIKLNEYVADDRKGRILAPQAGMILMPLYQKLGSDGFFIVKEIKSSKLFDGI